MELALCVMLKQERDKHKRLLKVVRTLLSVGCNVHIHLAISSMYILRPIETERSDNQAQVQTVNHKLLTNVTLVT